MKIEHLIVQHLYNNKKVTLQDIGSFILSSNVSMPSESSKDGVMPDNAISFEYNAKATEDESLIEFIVQQTRKIRPLATSDLESYTILGREYLNIGKPFYIEGLGTLQKTQNGTYEFIQGHSVNAKLQAAPAVLKEKDDEEIVFTSAGRKIESNKGPKIIFALIFLVVVAAVLIYILNKKSDNTRLTEAVMDTVTAVESTPVQQPVSTLPVTTSPAESSIFKVVVKEYSTREAAEKALTRLTGFGHNLELITKDSTSFSLVMRIYQPLLDSTLVKDSLARLFGSNTYVQP